MKKQDIKVGGLYKAKVSGKVVTVRVDRIKDQTSFNGKAATSYDVTNLSTGRKTTFRSAMKFRSAVIPVGSNPAISKQKQQLKSMLTRRTEPANGGHDGGEQIRRSEEADEEAARVDKQLRKLKPIPQLGQSRCELCGAPIDYIDAYTRCQCGSDCFI